MTRLIGVLSILLLALLLASCAGRQQGPSGHGGPPLPGSGGQPTPAEAGSLPQSAADESAQTTEAARPSGDAVQPAQASATPPAPQAAGRLGTVLAAQLNVRAGPSTSEPRIGGLQRGERVQIVDRQTDWLQIAYAGTAGGLGWVSASYVAIDGEPTPVAPIAIVATPAPTATNTRSTSGLRVAAPRAISYSEPIFAWEWSAQNQLSNTPWYFDILIFTRTGSDPYHVITAQQGDTRRENSLWRFDLRYRAQCDSYWVVQIARGAPGNFQGWISDRSNRQPIGEPCHVPGGGSAPPTPTPNCDGCP